jgi:hypothetical protein
VTHATGTAEREAASELSANSEAIRPLIPK